MKTLSKTAYAAWANAETVRRVHAWLAAKSSKNAKNAKNAKKVRGL